MSDEKLPDVRTIFLQGEALQQFKDDVARAHHGITMREALARRICIDCKQPPALRTDAERREYQISGLCGPCYDKLYPEEE